MKPLIHHYKRDPLGDIIGDGFRQFTSPTGINGLIKSERFSIELLTVVAKRPGRGQFREFIAQAKRQYGTIRVLQVINPMLKTTLLRYGFTGTDNAMEWRNPHLLPVAWEPATKFKKKVGQGKPRCYSKASI